MHYSIHNMYNHNFLNMNSNEGPRFFKTNGMNLQSDSQPLSNVTMYFDKFDTLDQQSSDYIQGMKTQSISQSDTQSYFKIGTSEKQLEDPDKFLQSQQLQSDSESLKNGQATQNQQNYMLQKNISDKSQDKSTDILNDRLFNYFQGHVCYLTSLKYPIFGQNTKFDRTKRKTAQQGYFSCIARKMKKNKKNRPDTDYAKRFDQRLRLNTEFDRQGIAITLQGLRALNRARNQNKKSQILDNFEKKYNSKRDLAVFLNYFVSSSKLKVKGQDGQILNH